MGATIVHFGFDQRANVMVLAQFYGVQDCGNSIPNLAYAVQAGDFDAIAITGDDAQVSEEAVRIAHSNGSHPVILFEGVSTKYNRSDFDLVIPSLTSTADWLNRISQLLKQSHTLCADTKLVREKATLSREGSASLRQESAELRKKAASERERAGRLTRFPQE